MKFCIVVIFCSIFLSSCSAFKDYPSIYPDIYGNKITVPKGSFQPLFYSSNKIFWIYCFKALATSSYLQSASNGKINFNNSRGEVNNPFYFEQKIIRSQFLFIADSIGSSAAVQKANQNLRFQNFLHFQSSVYLDTLAKKYYKLFKKDPLYKAQKKEARKIAREKPEHRDH